MKIENLKEKAHQLINHLPDSATLVEKPYRIIYGVKQNQIDDFAVINGAKILPEEIE